MPALTHGRVINGFNQYARSITYARPNCPEKPTRDTCGGQKPFCCGVPLQPFKIRPGSYCGSGFCRIPTGNSSRKRASATGVVGRSFAAKRAIGRRVANCQGRKKLDRGDTGTDHPDEKCCCMLPTVTFTKPVNAYHMPARCAKGSADSFNKRAHSQSLKFPGRVGGRCCLQQPCKGS